MKEVIQVKSFGAMLGYRGTVNKTFAYKNHVISLCPEDGRWCIYESIGNDLEPIWWEHDFERCMHIIDDLWR